MKKLIKLSVLVSFLVISLLISSLVSHNLKAQTKRANNSGEESLYAVRLMLGWNNQNPGGMGIKLTSMFDIHRVNISQGLKIYPSVGLNLTWAVDIDDPQIKHLLYGGMDLQVRFSIDLTRKSWSTTIEAVPWLGFSLNGCYTVTQNRGPDETTFTEISSGVQFCYGPTLGLDIEIGKSMVVGLGIQTLFFTLGSSGFEKAPFYSVGGVLSVGTKLPL